MARLQMYNKQFTITIPQDIIAQVRWIKGDAIIVSYLDNGNLTLKKVDKEVMN